MPVRYDRELMQTTLTAMKRVTEIRQRRERVFTLKRIAKAKQQEREDAAKEVEKNIDIIEEAPLQKRKQTLEKKQKAKFVEEDLDMEMA